MISIAVLYICRIVVSGTRNTIASSFQLHKFAHPSHTSLPSRGAWAESFYPRPLETSEMAEKAGRVGHYQAGKLARQNVDGFIQQMAKSTGGQVRRTASMTMAGITGAQPKHSKIRYARVLQGLESCGWCFMLASRGFVYRSEEAASHSHRGCKCVVMAGREGDTIEGYDLEGIQDRYNKVAKACGVDIFTDKDTRLDQLSREDYDRIARFAELHDPAWLSRGVIPDVDYSENPRSAYGRLLKPGSYDPENIVDRGTEWRDLFAHDMLSQAGIPVATHDHTQIDISIGDELWEIKSPDGDSTRSIERAIRKAKKQFGERLGFDHPVRVVLNTKYLEGVSLGQVMKRVVLEINRHGINEVIVIDREGEIAFITKQ